MVEAYNRCGETDGALAYLESVKVPGVLAMGLGFWVKGFGVRV